MPSTRRDLIGLTALVSSLAACSPRSQTVLRFLQRATYGTRPGDLERAMTIGLDACLEEQFELAKGPDDIDQLIGPTPTYRLPHRELLLEADGAQVTHEFYAATVGRALYSPRQLYETMVEFWSDHFYIFMRHHSLLVPLKVIDDREVIRPHALGNFRDLLFASAHSPAMLAYLSNVLNGKHLPNENYAREMLELHTLGVDSDYSQDDVEQMARVLTGWSARLVDRGHESYGKFFFDERMHDRGRKRVLQLNLREGRGHEELLDVLERLARHPHTARNVARKLVRRFVSDQPPAELVDRVAGTFLATGGDIKSMLRCLFSSEEFASAPAKLKRPTKFAVSALRALGCAPDRHLIDFVLTWLMPLGQPPFQWRLPNGYPDVATPYYATLYARWNFAFALLDGRLAQVDAALARLLEHSDGSVATLASTLLHSELPAALERKLTELLPAHREHSGPAWRDVAMILLTSPRFQWT
ncbi:MAG: DUF1800 domain-containing protein [Planctomycetota bacterium]